MIIGHACYMYIYIYIYIYIYTYEDILFCVKQSYKITCFYVKQLKDYLGVRYLQVYGKELNRRGKVNLVVI